MFYFLYLPLHSTHNVFATFGNLVNVLHDYQLIQVGSSSEMVSTLVLPFSCLDGIELGFLRQQSCNLRETIKMLYVINEVTIETCIIHQIKENAEVKSNR